MTFFYILCIVGILFSAYLIYTTPTESYGKVRVVHAGNIHGVSMLAPVDINQIPELLDVNGSIIRTADYSVFQVEGESMKMLNIHSGDIVFAKPVALSDLTPKNTIVLRIPNQIGAYKLRQFEYIIPRDDSTKTTQNMELQEKIKNCIDSYREEQTFIISKTFDIQKNKERYSVHPSLLLEGRVFYKIEQSDL